MNDFHCEVNASKKKADNLMIKALMKDAELNYLRETSILNYACMQFENLIDIIEVSLKNRELHKNSHEQLQRMLRY